MARTVIAAVLFCAVGAVATGMAGGHSPATGGHSPPADAASPVPGQPLVSCPASVRGLGSIALTARGRLELIDLRACRIRQLATGVAAGARFSRDGRWLAYSRSGAGSPAVVRVSGGAARSPLGAGIVSWWWAPTGELLYGVNHRGQLLVAAPDGPARGGDVRGLVTGRPLAGLLGTGAVLGVAVGGRVATGGGPGAGWPAAVPGHRPHAAVPGLPRLVRAYAHRGLRPRPRPRPRDAAGQQVRGDRSAVLAPAHRRPAAHLSWVSPACSPSGTLLAAAAGPNTQDSQFGVQHRSIWLLAPSGRMLRRLTTPPARELSDEAPRFSRSGRWILFVRTRVQRRTSLDTLELVPAARSGAARIVPLVRFTSGDISFYDHFSWPQEVDWSAA